MSAENTIPLVNLKRQYVDLASKIDAALKRECEKGEYILGGAVSLFEKEFAAAMGVSECVGVSNGTDALHLMLRAVGIKEGDEVILPANSYIATAFAVSQCGAKPVFVDCDPKTALMDPKATEVKINSKTKALLPVHLFGQPADMEAFLKLSRSKGIPVLEDAAQAHGAALKDKACGSIGFAAGFSFYPGKNLGAYGDGGAITTNDAELAKKLRLLRNFGSPAKYIHSIPGFNSRLDTLQAAILSVKLTYLKEWNAKRAKLAEYYHKKLAPLGDKVSCIEKAAWTSTHAWHLFVVSLKKGDRDAILKKMQDKGIGVSVHYPVPIHLQECYRSLGHREGDFPNAERFAKNMISLPLCPYITENEIDRVVSELSSLV